MVPIYAHELELPDLNGRRLIAADPTVGGGIMPDCLLRFLEPAWLMSPSTARASEVMELFLLCQVGAGCRRLAIRRVTILWREKDRAIIGGDAFITTYQGMGFRSDGCYGDAVTPAALLSNSKTAHWIERVIQSKSGGARS